MYDAAEIERARQAIARLAGDMLAGKLSFLDGARLIPPLCFEARLDERDPDRLVFVAISSETHALPRSDLRG